MVREVNQRLESVRRWDAAPDRSGAGYGAKRRRWGDLAFAGCTGLAAALPRAVRTLSNTGDSRLKRPRRDARWPR